jgi:hypothetical protein
MPLVDNAWYVNFGNGSSTGYYAVTAWAASAGKVCGNLVRQLAAPAVNSERVFVCVASTAGTGTTGGAEPAWVLTRGAKTTDNTVTWQEATGVAALNGDLTNTPLWSNAGIKGQAIVLGQVIQNVAGTLVLICTTAGTAGAGAEPSWSAFTNAGATTADNTVTWTSLGAQSNFTGWQAPHARLANAYASTWGQSGNSFFVASEHAETQATALTLTSPSLSNATSFVYCVNKSNVPPTSANITTGATITTTGNSNLLISTNTAGAETYYNGITFSCGSGANAPLLVTASGQGVNAYINCSLQLAGTTGGSIFSSSSTPGAQTKVKWINTTVKFASTAANITGTSDIFWANTASAILGATIPTSLITMGAPVTHTLIGVDLSAAGSGVTLVPATLQGGKVIFQDCKFGASVTVAATPTSLGCAETYVVRSDSSATNYRQEKYQYTGTQTAETTIVRTGGASDGTTPISWKIVSTANSKWTFPFEAIPITIWNDVTATNRTVTIYGIWGGGAVPNNDDIWIDVDYLGSSATPLGTIATLTKANNLAANAALTTDASTWGGSTTPFKMVLTLSSPQPGLKGYFNIYVKGAKPSTTFYIDPLAVLS